MMRKSLKLLVLAALVLGSCTSVKRTLKKEYTVVSYNVENLFDTIDDPKIPDESTEYQDTCCRR